MRAAVVDRAGFSIHADLPIPAVAENEVLIRVLGCGMCGSDLHVFERDPNYTWVEDRFPLIMGHEIVGCRVPVGGDESEASPSRVVVRPRAGQREDGSPVRIGWDRAGGFAEYVSVPSDCVYDLPADLDVESASLCEPLAVAVSALRRSGLRPRFGPDLRAQVVGMGAVGALAACVLAAEGCADVEIVGTERDRRLGSFEVLAGLGLSPVLPEAASSGQELVVNAAGSAEAYAAGVQRLARGGTLLNIALGLGEVSLDADLLTRNEHSIVSTYGSRAVDWETATGYLSSGAIRPRSIISHTVPLEELVAGFELLQRGEARKVFVDMVEKG
ncbi:zinc-dependent alcohol dehydrogenase [Brevibacterium album]|uniref:zinc-dependent alcohol dehydrogenase n=1 Tax=Brevibacterium album TaxID=417948 RepID=UPI000A033058|nr:alcohol dehydrogenase catalytic domain-containing protein [Brevibacterium album]